VPYPTKPTRQYSFTDHSTNQPTTPQPGNNLDGEYDRTNISVGQVIDFVGVSLNTDGTLRTASVGKPQLAPGVFDFIANDAIAEVQPLVDEAQSFANSASSSSQTAQAAATAADHSATTSSGAASTASTAASNAQVSASAAQTSATTAGNSASASANSASNAAGDLAACTDYAVLTQAWAEHMPDTIPPNILAVMDVTGDHWSSRWWANRTIQHGNDVIAAFERYYLGAFAVPPTADSQGNPISTGALYYDLTMGAMYVWNGTGWQPASTPSPVQTYRTIWVAGASQTVFTGNDRDGHPLVYNPASNQQIAVYKQGLLLVPPTDYTATLNQVTLTAPASVGNIVQIWVESIPTVKLDWRTARIDTTAWVFDGSQTTFLLKDTAGATLIVAAASDLLLSMDGVWQQAFTDYTVSSSTLVFVTAPTSDMRTFGIAIVPVPDVPTPQPGVTSIDTTSWVFDGVAVTFPILDRSANPVVPVAAENLLLSLNGVWQAAALDYSVAGSTVTFAVAPDIDDKAFGVAGLPAFAA
jgi:hypothetical protein